MLFGATGPVHDWKIVLGEPAFAFTEFKGYVNGPADKEGPRKSAYNTWYKKETMNEKYRLDGSYYLFSYKDKIGFVAIKDNKKHIFFNRYKVSGDFDEIRTYSCCAIMPYPLKIYDNGILFFMGKRGEKYFLVEVNLNKYL